MSHVTSYVMVMNAVLTQQSLFIDVIKVDVRRVRNDWLKLMYSIHTGCVGRRARG